MRKKKKENIIKGTLSKHSRGFGFVIPDDKDKNQQKDIYIAPGDMAGAMDDDRVEVLILNRDNHNASWEGMVRKVLKHANKDLVGTLIKRGDHGYIVPIMQKGKDLALVSQRNFKGGKNGDRVVADIIRWPDKNSPAQARVREIISRKGESGGDIKALIRAFKLTDKFPQQVVAEAEKLPRQIEHGDTIDRRDLREETIITIDGADAKDLDDGISIKQLENGNYLLGVHIADVSHYVKEASPLDMEALNRATSVYLIDLVVPMLPPELSNGICSLLPGEDRLALSVTMEIDESGHLISHEIFESLICSKERMIYTDVSDMLEDHREDLIEKFEHVYPKLLLMDELATILRERRKERGSLDFDIGESVIALDKKGVPINVEEAERRIANRIIEEFMLMANETIATHFFHLDLPFIYRVHEKPSLDKIHEFRKFLIGVGITIKGDSDNIHPRALNDVLDQVRKTSIEKVVNTVMLRSMKKASYEGECLGHFGLSLNYYCHFTAPIRRYPDLFIHRVIKDFLRGQMYGEKMGQLKEFALEAASQASTMERRAEDLEREVEKLKKAEYMSKYIGEDFTGIISGLASFGFFVELDNTIEGLVRIDSVSDDYYIYEAQAYRFIGENTGRIFRLGDSVGITVLSVDIEAREINFSISDLDSRRKG